MLIIFSLIQNKKLNALEKNTQLTLENFVSIYTEKYENKGIRIHEWNFCKKMYVWPFPTQFAINRRECDADWQ